MNWRPAPLLLGTAVLFIAAFSAAACNYSYLNPASPSTDDSGTTSGGTTGGSGTTSAAPTYVKDVQPILAADCVRCHGPSRREDGVDVSTYNNVMKYVSPGNANSILILVTRSGGIMFGQFSGNASQKAATIRTWIVSNNAAQQ